MYTRKMNHKIIPGLQICNILKEQNDLGISKIEYIVKRQKNLMILLAESDLLVNENELYAFVRDHTLVIEATLHVDVEMPFRTHLIEQKNLEEFDNEIAEIRFTEIKLDKKYRYNVISLNMIKPGLLKIVMSCKPAKYFKKWNNGKME
jgi:hypothetical protein